MTSFNKLPFKKTQRPSVPRKFLHHNWILTTFLLPKQRILLCHFLFDKPDLDDRSRLRQGCVTLCYSTTCPSRLDLHPQETFPKSLWKFSTASICLRGTGMTSTHPYNEEPVAHCCPTRSSTPPVASLKSGTVHFLQPRQMLRIIHRGMKPCQVHTQMDSEACKLELETLEKKDCWEVVEIPRGFAQDKKVLKLKKSLYGLKHSLRNHFKTCLQSLLLLVSSLVRPTPVYLFLTNVFAWCMLMTHFCLHAARQTLKQLSLVSRASVWT
jgi:hypothetical protein